MNLSPKIEAKLRETARKKGWTEVEYLHYKETLIKFVTVAREESKRKAEIKINKAA